MPDWRKRLEAFLSSRRQAAFSWGVNDGALFCADAVLAMTGIDVAAGVRGQYTTREGAEALIGSAGGLEALVTQYLESAPLEGVLLARVGDVVMARISDGTDCIGISLGAYAAFVSDAGLSKVRISRCTRAWRVG